MRNRIELPYAPPPRGFMLDPTHPLARGLVGWWPLNGDAADYSKHGNNAVRSATATGQRGGHWYGTHFDGSASRIDVSSSPSLSPVSAITATIMARMNVGSGTHRVLMDRAYTSHEDPYYSWTLRVSNTGDVFCAVPVGAYDVTDLVIAAPALPTLNRWARFTMTYDGANILLYDNAVLLGTRNNPGAITYYGTELVIGRFRNIAAYFSGQLADARIYNRALSAAEVKLLYERPFEMCVDAWPFRSYSIPAGGYPWGRRATGIWSPGRA